MITSELFAKKLFYTWLRVAAHDTLENGTKDVTQQVRCLSSNKRLVCMSRPTITCGRSVSKSQDLSSERGSSGVIFFWIALRGDKSASSSLKYPGIPAQKIRGLTTCDTAIPKRKDWCGPALFTSLHNLSRIVSRCTILGNVICKPKLYPTEPNSTEQGPVQSS